MNKLYRFLSESYIFVMILALGCGLFLSSSKALVPWNTFFLQIIFFLSCLKIDLPQIRGSLRDWKALLLANALKLIGSPFLVWLVINPFAPEFGLALFLLAAMPVGMTAPLLVDVAGGKQALAMVLTVMSSLLAPVTIPLLTKGLYGATIAVDAFEMFKQLALVIVLPFILALVTRTLLPTIVNRVKQKTKPVSIIFLGLLIAGAVAKQSQQMLALSHDWWKPLLIIAILYLFFIVMHFVGFYACWWEKYAVKNTVSISLVYMNFTLAIFLASSFFPQSEILLPLVLSILPWATLLPVWTWVSKKYLRSSQT